MLIKRIPVGSMGVNCYIFGSRSECIVLDPGGNVEMIHDYIKDQGLSVKYIVLTHCHFDHILAAQSLKDKTNAQIVACSAEKENLKNSCINMTGRFTRVPFGLDAEWYVSEGDIISSGEYEFSVIETPGHTSGGMCIYCASENVLFSGDTLFCGSIGRSDFPTGDYNMLISSIRTKLYSLPEHTKVFPGHEGETTIEREKKHNPFTI